MSDHQPPRPDRRALLGSTLGLAAGAALLPGCGGSKADTADEVGGALAPEGLDPADFISHGTSPWTLETRRALLDGAITPTDRVFVRGNLAFPAESVLEDRDAWCVQVEGVGEPKTLSVSDLKSLGRTSVAAVLQCSGNGRRFFEHDPSGSPWGVGAAANVLWTGVPLKTVVEHLGGAAAGTRFATAAGGDPLPEGIDRQLAVVERSVPLADAMANALLAWDMNGEPLPLAHGGPLRLVMPGYYGVNQVKYLEQLALTPEESEAKIQVSGYRVRPIGEKGTPAFPSMWRMNVKSWITSPLETATAGARMVTGVAFSGGDPITRVEVSSDGGSTWADAELTGPDLGPFAWRTFAASWQATAGSHTLLCRATDAGGQTQPELRQENQRGYAHNGWRDHGVTVTVS